VTHEVTAYQDAHGSTRARYRYPPASRGCTSTTTEAGPRASRVLGSPPPADIDETLSQWKTLQGVMGGLKGRPALGARYFRSQ
jgi:hypothetical protein